MDGLIRDAVKTGRTVKVLNLFGYTGVASLVAARAGAEVTHVDASKRPFSGRVKTRKWPGFPTSRSAGSAKTR